jgi:hypothetical protein
MGPRSLLLFLLSLFICSSAIPQHGAYTAPVPFDQMVQRAATIVRGHVVSVSVEPHPQFFNLKTVVVTIRTDRTLKGDASRDLTFRQYIWDARDIDDAAGYRKKDELLLFLNAPSDIGLTSPVGLGAGRFRITRDQSGNAFALNEHGNAGLSAQISFKAKERGVELSRESQAAFSQAQGRIPLSALEEAILAFAQARQ